VVPLFGGDGNTAVVTSKAPLMKINLAKRSARNIFWI
jgi:hypothetical protein